MRTAFAPDRSPKRAHRERPATIAGVTLLYAALTMVFAYPLSVKLVHHVLGLSSDTRLWIWTLEWDTHAFLHQPFSIFNANIFYPARDALAFSENLIGSAFFAAPVLWLTGNPVLALNVVTLLSCLLCALGAWLLARRLGVSVAGAILCGLIFGFSPPRFLRIEQLHLCTVEWIPFSLAFLHTYLDEGRRRDLWLAVGFFTLQALTSGHGGMFLLVAIICLLAYRAVLGEPIRLVRRIRDFGLPGLILIAPVFPVLEAYRTAQLDAGLRRTLGDAAQFAAKPASFLASPAHVNVWLLHLMGHSGINAAANAYLFPGYLTLLLAVLAWLPWCRPRRPAMEHRGSRLPRWIAALLEFVALILLGIAIFVAVTGPQRIYVARIRLLSVQEVWRVWFWFAFVAGLRLAMLERVPFDLGARFTRVVEAVRAWRARQRVDARTFYTLLTLLSIWFCVGPPFGPWRFVYWLPGFDFIRVPSRFVLLAVLGLGVVASIGFDGLTRRLRPGRRSAVAVVVGVLLATEFAAFPLSDLFPYRVQIPAADRWLATRPGSFAIAEVPEGDPHNAGAWNRRQTEYMLDSTAHWQKTVHGYSGIVPPVSGQLLNQLTHFPDETSLRHLVSIHVRYIVVHTNLYDPHEWPRVEQRIEAYRSWLTLVHVAGAGRVYELHAPSNPSTSGSQPAPGLSGSMQ